MTQKLTLIRLEK
jgi:ubiquitin-protein ligase